MLLLVLLSLCCCCLLLVPNVSAASFEEVASAIDNYKYLSDLYFLVANSSGVAFTHQKGVTVRPPAPPLSSIP